MAFISAVAPLPSFRKVLDVCCGMGRHARALSGLGYEVTGVERDAFALAEARRRGGGPRYLQVDVQHYEPEPGASDLVIIMSQSFGYFDAATNREVLRRLTNGLRRGGRLILDLWNPEFFATHQGTRDFSLPAGSIRETKRVEDGRLFVHLEYPNQAQDAFEWQLFTPAEMESFAAASGLTLVAACTDFNVAVKPSPTNPRLQFILEARRPVP